MLVSMSDVATEVRTVISEELTDIGRAGLSEVFRLWWSWVKCRTWPWVVTACHAERVSALSFNLNRD